MMRIGIISDTHGVLRPDAIKHLAGTDHIIHAGDIGTPEVIEGLRRIAPTTAIRGNIDAGKWAMHYPDTELVVLGGRAFYVLHNLKELKLDPAASGFDVIISGHSHHPKIETKTAYSMVSLRRGPPSVKGGDERRFDHRMQRGEKKCPQTQLWAQTSGGGTERGRSL